MMTTLPSSSLAKDLVPQYLEESVCKKVMFADNTEIPDETPDGDTCYVVVKLKLVLLHFKVIFTVIKIFLKF